MRLFRRISASHGQVSGADASPSRSRPPQESDWDARLRRNDPASTPHPPLCVNIVGHHLAATLATSYLPREWRVIQFRFGNF